MVNFYKNIVTKRCFVNQKKRKKNILKNKDMISVLYSSTYRQDTLPYSSSDMPSFSFIYVRLDTPGLLITQS